MIKKLIQKVIPCFFLVLEVVFFVNINLSSSIKIKEIKEENSPKEEDALLLKVPTLPLSYTSYNRQNIPQAVSQSAQIPFVMVSGSISSAVVHTVLINFDYNTNPVHIIMKEIDISEPKDFLTVNLNKELQEKIYFSSNLPIATEGKNNVA